MGNSFADNLLKDIFREDNKLDIKSRFEEKIKEYGISRTRALRLLNIDKVVFEKLLDGTAKQPNLIHIVKITEFLDIDLQDFITIVLNNQSSDNIASIDKVRKAKFLMENFDVKKLTNIGFFQKKDDIDYYIDKILYFFGYETIADFEEAPSIPLYSRSKRNFSDKMKDFWVRSAYETFKLVSNPNEYNRENLKDIVTKIKPYSQDVDDGLYKVCRALYNAGITVIFQNYLETTHIRGATFIFDEKPYIVLTDYNNAYPTIWFTLMHELHHVLFDFDSISTNTYHLSDDQDLFLIEEEANRFARDYFLPKEKYLYIKPYINNDYLVRRFARENEIHPSLVYAFYAWYHHNLYDDGAIFGKVRRFYPDYKQVVRKLKPITWKQENLKEVSEKIQHIFQIK